LRAGQTDLQDEVLHVMKWKMGFLTAAAVVVVVGAAPAVWAKTCDVKAFGAKGDGVTKDTVAIQKAVDACAGNEKNVVMVSGGTFLSGPISLKTGTTLEIAKGTTLLGSPDREDYPKVMFAGHAAEGRSMATAMCGGIM
jgi:polygalacturonase